MLPLLEGELGGLAGLTSGWLKLPRWLDELPYVGRPDGTGLLDEYPVDGDLYPIGGFEAPTPPLKFDRPPLPLLFGIRAAGRLSPGRSKLRLRIEDAPLSAGREPNPLVGRGIFAMEFPMRLLPGSILPTPLVVESQKWFETNLLCPWTKKPL